MLGFVKLFGRIILIFGIVILVKPQILRAYLLFWRQDKWLKIGGIISMLFGIIFLIAAPQCLLVWLIAILGIWSIIKGLLLLVINKEKIFTYIDWWQNKSLLTLRLLGLFIIAFGLLIIYSA